MEQGSIKSITGYTPPSMDVIGIKDDSNSEGSNTTSVNEVMNPYSGRDYSFIHLLLINYVIVGSNCTSLL
jgi:hypothetical protein